MGGAPDEHEDHPADDESSDEDRVGPHRPLDEFATREDRRDETGDGTHTEGGEEAGRRDRRREYGGIGEADREPRVTDDNVGHPSESSGDPVELGVALLERLEHVELSLAETMDRIELVTQNPTTVRQILEEAERRGMIEREGATVRPKSHAFVRFERDVVTREGEFTCRRCGSSIATGHFVKLHPGELGPFGSSCIRKVTGRK